MKHMKKLVLFGSILLTLVMGSCDALFSNKFQELGLGQVDPAALAEADSDTLIAQSGINSGTISQSFIDAALADADTKAAVVAELTTAAGSSDPEVAQTAQVLLIELELQDSGADEVVGSIGSVIDVIMNDDNFDPSTPEDLNALIDALVPDSLAGDDASLAAVFDALGALGGAGGAIDDFGAALVADGGLQNDNIDASSVAQTAVLASVIAILQPGAGAPPGATTGEALVAALNDPANFNNYVSIPDSDLDGTSDLEELSSDPNLAAILDAGGLGFLLDQIGGGA
jgi:hypothetical protein